MLIFFVLLVVLSSNKKINFASAEYRIFRSSSTSAVKPLLSLMPHRNRSVFSLALYRKSAFSFSLSLASSSSWSSSTSCVGARENLDKRIYIFDNCS